MVGKSLVHMWNLWVIKKKLQTYNSLSCLHQAVSKSAFRSCGFHFDVFSSTDWNFSDWLVLVCGSQSPKTTNCWQIMVHMCKSLLICLSWRTQIGTSVWLWFGLLLTHSLQNQSLFPALHSYKESTFLPPYRRRVTLELKEQILQTFVSHSSVSFSTIIFFISTYLWRVRPQTLTK